MHFLEGAYLFGAPTTVLMRSSIVRSRRPFYDEDTWLVEDLSACYEVLRQWDFGFVHQILTFVRTRNDGSILSARRGFDAMSLDRLAVITRHGADFLDSVEYRQAYRLTKKYYYSRLAVGVLQRKGSEFWEYHRTGLDEIGAHLEYLTLAGHVVGEVVRLLANPGHSAIALYRALRARWTRPRPRHEIPADPSGDGASVAEPASATLSVQDVARGT
jgi:hypothetical protein